MITFYYSLAPNPMKVALCLEEMGLAYELKPVDTRKGDQHSPDFLAVNPNGKVPAIIDQDTGATVFDSNAILLYLAEKTGQFLPENTPPARAELLSWLMFVATGVGPFSGQAVHFKHFAPEPKDYAVNRYLFEAKRHYSILDVRLAKRRYMLGETYAPQLACAFGLRFAEAAADRTLGTHRRNVMTLSMYQASVPVFLRGLRTLSGILDKGAADAAERKIDPTVLLTARLAPDMFPFTRQVQIASDHAKGATARLAGVEVPRFEDVEKSFGELQQRLQRVIEFVATFDAARIDGSEEREISLPIGGRTLTFSGQMYLLNFALPNFYFHSTTAYAILRHNGVGVGKRDFIGPVE